MLFGIFGKRKSEIQSPAPALPADALYRVWHNPQLGTTAEPFHVETRSLNEAKKLAQLLSEYDEYLEDLDLKYGYLSNCGIEVYDKSSKEWVSVED